MSWTVVTVVGCCSYPLSSPGSSSSKTVKEVKERILKAKGNPGLDKVTDINVICGVLSNFLKSLREPILTFNMQPIFIKASGEGGREGGREGA